jgi:mono/diheme cytochrome c family protein
MRHSLLAFAAFALFGCTGSGKDDVPAGSLMGNAIAGQQLYTTTCAQCHGSEGQGNGPGAKHINPKPADLRSRVGQYDNRGLFLLIRKGGMFVGKPAMPPSPQLTDQQIMDLLAYLRSLAGEAT